MVRLSLSVCVHCAICADSCFKFRASGNDPTYSPSYKAINSIGLIHRRRARLSPAEWEMVKDLAWNKCVLCMRCYCPLGISIPTLIARARRACRAHGYERTWDSGVGRCSGPPVGRYSGPPVGRCGGPPVGRCSGPPVGRCGGPPAQGGAT